MNIAHGRSADIISDNHTMTASAGSPLGRILRAPFTRRTWAELWYTLVTVPLTLAAVAFTLAGIGNGPLWAASAPGVRKFGAASRFLARGLLSEDVPAPPRLQPMHLVRVRTAGADRLTEVAVAAGGRVRPWQTGKGITVYRLPMSRIAELAAKARIPVDEMRPGSSFIRWTSGALHDRPAWRARAYFVLRLPLAAGGLVAAAGGWLGGVYYLSFPVWWTLGLAGPFGWFHVANLAYSFALLPLGAALQLAGPWLTHGITEADRWLIRGLLGPSSPAERIRALEESRARAVDDSAARLRSIERDLHDGTQAQLVALAMKLGLAKEKLSATAPLDLARVTRLVEDAHQSALEAIAELRTLARGIHPSVLDNGLADALTSLAARSAVPVELVTDVPERPSAAIETIAYFSAAELLTNVAKHSEARHATLEAIHVPGLLRIRVTDDGHGGASPVPGGGLRGLVERVRTVDGRLDIASPPGGPTVVTVELPSHA